MMKSKGATEIRGIIRETPTNKTTMGVNGKTVLINKIIMVINGTIAIIQALIKIDGTLQIINKITMVINGILATKQIMETIKVNGMKTIMEANGIIMANNIKTMKMAALMIKETIGEIPTNGMIKEVMETLMEIMVIMDKVNQTAAKINGLLIENI